MVQVIQPSFAAGELSPDVYSRVDIAKYNVGLREAYNGFVRAQGGWSNRSGYEFITPTKYQAKKGRVITFQFNTVQTYTLEFGDQYMRVLKDGGLVLETAKNITGITRANPAVVTSAAHGFANGNWVYISGVVGMTQVNGKFFQVANVATNTFELQDVYGTNINSSAYTAYSSGGTAARVYEIATPYLEADLPLLDVAQSNDVMTVAHGLYAPRDLTRTGHAAWTLSTITFAPLIAAPTGQTATATVATGTGLITYRYVITAVANETFEESLASSIASCSNNLNTAGNYNTIAWSAVAGAMKYNIYRETNNSGVYGFIAEAMGVSVTDQNINPDETDTPPAARNPFVGAGNYPGAVSYHEQRRIFGYTVNKPQTVYASQAGNYKNLNVSSPARDDDAWTFGVASEQVNAIRYLISQNDLLVFTSGAEFVFRPGRDGDTITPSSIAVRPESRYGSAHIRPVVIGKTVLFAESSQSTDAQDKGYSVRDLGYTFTSDDYNGNDLTILAKHLFYFNQLTAWAYAKRPFGILWGVRDDGILAAITYLKEHEVYAWHRHETDGYFESICTTPEQGEDAPYVIVERIINGNTRRYIERQRSRKFRNVEDAFFVDCGLTLDNWNDTATTVTLSGGTNWTVDETLTLTASAAAFAVTDIGRRMFIRLKRRNGEIIKTVPVDVTTYTSTTVIHVVPAQIVPSELRSVATVDWAFGQATISGLDHLEGKTVAILADGNVEEQTTVVAGTITLPNPVAKAHIGLPYYSDLRPLAIAGDVSKGSLLGHPVNVGKVQIVVQETRGVLIGPNADRLRPYVQRQFENWGEPTRLKTGVIEVISEGDWADGSFLLRQVDPLPVTVLGLIPDVQFGEIPGGDTSN